MDLLHFPEFANLPEVSRAVAPVVVAAVPAAISAIASLFGAKKGSTAAKEAATIQTDFGQKALDEQKRVYDLERADEQRQRDARAGIFDRYSTNPGMFSGNLPNPYGMSDPQAFSLRQGTMGTPGTPGKMLPPSGPSSGGTSPQPVPFQAGPQTPWQAPGQGKPTVTLQAPTGEIMDVDLDQAPALIKKGAVIIPKRGAQNAFGVSYGMV